MGDLQESGGVGREVAGIWCIGKMAPILASARGSFLPQHALPPPLIAAIYIAARPARTPAKLLRPREVIKDYL
jgi:hypothetical protein